MSGAGEAWPLTEAMRDIFGDGWPLALRTCRKCNRSFVDAEAAHQHQRHCRRRRNPPLRSTLAADLMAARDILRQREEAGW